MKHIKKCLILAVAGLPLLNSCSDSWLEPKPLSIYTPENTYVCLLYTSPSPRDRG